MIADALNAWVIHKYWSGDTSARVVFFTREQGLVTCLYKGGRSPKKQALLQPFIPLWLAMDVRGEARYVRQLEIAATPIQLAGQTMFAGLYVNELIFHALKTGDPHPEFHAAYMLTLKSLLFASDRITLESLLRRFEWSLLTSCGYHMSLTHEARTAKPIVSTNSYRFIAGEGFIVADAGDERTTNGAHILAMSQDKLDDIIVLNAAKRIMRHAIDHALDGKEIKARALYRSNSKR